MFPMAHAEARCQNRERCTGPGCRFRTGKTERKRTGRGLPLMGHYRNTTNTEESTN